MAKLTQEEFYAKYLPIVTDSVKGTGLIPEVVVAQMGIESGWGGSGLSVNHNNFFGIKKGKSDASSVNMASDEEVGDKKESVKSDFRTYNSVEESIDDYVHVIKTQGGGKTYAKVLEAKTPEAQAEALGNSPYATGKNYGQSIKNTIKANKPYTMGDTKKKTSMFDKHTQKKIDDIKSNHSLKRRELALLKREKGPKSDDYWKAKNQFDKEVKWVIEKEYEAKKAAAKSNYKIHSNLAKNEKDPTKKAELLTQAEDYFDTYEEFEKGQDEVDRITMKADLDMEGYNIIDAAKDMGRIQEETGEILFGSDESETQTTMHDYFADEIEAVRLEEEDKPAEDLFDKDKGYQPKSSGTGGSSSSSKKNTQIETRPNRTKTGDGVGKHSGKTYTAKEELEKAKKERALLNDADINKYQFEASDPGTEGPLGSLVDVGRGIAGMIGATKEVPEYERGSMFNTAMGEAEARRDEGLSPDELNYRNQQSETAYAYNVKNIRRGAGGSAGAYLGNVQSAAAQLYGDYGKTAAVDEELRRKSRQNFQGMALKDEAINRTMFQDELSQTVATKQAGAGLVQDAIKNISERRDYNRQYGKDSPYFKYTESLREATEQSSHDTKEGNRLRVEQNKAEAEFNVDKAQDKYDKENNLNPEEDVKKVVEKQKGETEEAPSKYDALIESEMEKAEAKPSAAAEEGEISTGGTVKKASITTSPEKDKAEATIKKNIEKARPKKLQDELDTLVDAEQYGGLTKDQEGRKKKLKKLKKNNWAEEN